VVLCLSDDGSGNTSAIGPTITSATFCATVLSFVRDGSAITQQGLSVYGASAATVGIQLSPSSYAFIDTKAPAGAHTYTVTAYSNSVSTSSLVANCVLQAYEQL
jgi:hypothetical protein